MNTLLIVDGNAAHRRLYKKEFEKEGFSVLTTPSGAEALTLLTAFNPDLVILDPLLMSDIDGFEIVNSIRQREPLLPVVLNTAYAAFSNHTMTACADAFILKSSNLEALKACVRRLTPSPSRASLMSFMGI